MKTPTLSPRVEQVHQSSFVFDACVPPMGFWHDSQTEVSAIVAGGFGGVSVTCAQPRATYEQAIDNISRLRQVADDQPARTVMCASVDELERARAGGRTGLVVHFQEPKPIEEDPARVEEFYGLGLRILQLSYDTQSLLASGCAERRDGGLSHLGVRVIEECNRLGILVDISHCSYQSVRDAIEVSTEPIALTHGGAHALCAATGRNKTDELLRAIGEQGGVIGVCWFSPMLKREPTGFRTMQAQLHDVLDHIDHIVDIVGPHAVGIGSDLSNLHARTLEVPAHSSLKWYRALRPDVFGEGSNERLVAYPDDLDSHAKVRNLTAGLVERKYGDDEIRGIMGHNWLRLFRSVWRH